MMSQMICKIQIRKFIITNKKYNFKIWRAIFMLWINNRKITINKMLILYYGQEG